MPQSFCTKMMRRSSKLWYKNDGQSANRRDCGEVIYFDPTKIQKGQVSGIQVFQNPNRIIPSPQGGFCTEFRSLRFSSRIPPGSQHPVTKKIKRNSLGLDPKARGLSSLEKKGATFWGILELLKKTCHRSCIGRHVWLDIMWCTGYVVTACFTRAVSKSSSWHVLQQQNMKTPQNSDFH